MDHIKKVAVIGAGTMGSGIASHVANTGRPVVLLDTIPEGAKARNRIAASAIERMLGSRPPAFMDQRSAELITPGNTEDHLDWLADADWIAEAIVERVDVKQAPYEKIDAMRKPRSLVSSNTSTIPLARLTENMSVPMRQDFCITHFFNPVRYMRLLELVAGPDTRPDTIDQLAQFCDIALGKGVVHCSDTPGFLGNRVGVYALQTGLVAARQLGLRVEEADAIMGRPMGIPKTGVFGLYDLIGLDLMLDVASSLASELPRTDPFQEVASGIPLITELVAQGYTGNKGLGGFFRVEGDSANNTRQAIDLDTGEYRPAIRPSLETARIGEREGLRALVACDDKYGRFAWRVLSRTLAYAAALVPGTSEDLLPIDEAMKLGYGWNRGPFEMIDELGPSWFCQRLADDGLAVPPILAAAAERPLYRAEGHRLRYIAIDGSYRDVSRPCGVARLSDTTRAATPLAENAAASFWDIGDGVGCIEFHTKANALSPLSMELIREAVWMAEKSFKALLMYNDAPHFSVGFNLEYALGAAKRDAWEELDRSLLGFQQACLSLKYAKVPVVSAPSGMALGGGYEVLIHSHALQAHSNSVMGLVETIVGLVPSGGGCKELLHRWTDPTTSIEERVAGALKVFEIIGMGKTGSSPVEWQRLRLALDRDRNSMNRDRLLLEAKRLALALVHRYRPPASPRFKSLGNAGHDAMHALLDDLAAKGITTPHDQVVGQALAKVVCGGAEPQDAWVSEKDLCSLEREAFISLAKTKGTVDRIEHMLTTGKPLRN